MPWPVRTNTGLIVVGFCACNYVVILFLINSQATAELDASILIQINGLTSSRLVAYLADFATQFGSDLILGIIAILVFALSKSNRNLALRLLAVVVLSDAVVFAFRTVYVRPRPYETITNIILPAGSVNDPSFPSGHATRVFGFVTALIGTKGRKYMPAIILAVAVGISRVVLGVHYPWDVVAGSFLGIALGVVTVVIDEWRGISKRVMELVGFCTSSTESKRLASRRQSSSVGLAVDTGIISLDVSARPRLRVLLSMPGLQRSKLSPNSGQVEAEEGQSRWSLSKWSLLH